MFRTSLFVIVLVFTTTQLKAQKTWEAGLSGGKTGYMGDINPRDFYRFSGTAYGAFAKRNFDGYWSAKLFLMQGNIAANDLYFDSPYQQNRQLSFYSKLTEASLQVEFNFFEYIAGVSRTRISPYLFTGIGAVKFNPKRKVNDIVYELNDYQTEGQAKPYNTIALSIPYGIGVKYNIRSTWTLVAELGYRTAQTDYLDDVSMNYPMNLSGTTGLLADPSGTAIAGDQRGDYRKRDTYMFAGLSLTFTFVGKNCPVAR